MIISAKDAQDPVVHRLTFPRRGHHFLIKILDLFVVNALVTVSEIQLGWKRACLINNHGLQTRKNPLPGYRHLVQTRNPIPSIISRYKQMLRTKEVEVNSQLLKSS